MLGVITSYALEVPPFSAPTKVVDCELLTLLQKEAYTCITEAHGVRRPCPDDITSYIIYPIFPQCAISQNRIHAAVLTGLITWINWMRLGEKHGFLLYLLYAATQTYHVSIYGYHVLKRWHAKTQCCWAYRVWHKLLRCIELSDLLKSVPVIASCMHRNNLCQTRV